MKKGGRKHRPYYRICVMDQREPRNGKVIEEVGTYDPMIKDRDLRVTMKGERIDYWVSVGAQPSVKVAALIVKFKGKVPEKRIETRKVPAIVERMSANRASADKKPADAPEAAPAADAGAAG